MENESKTSAPVLEMGRVVSELVLPVSFGFFYDRAMPVVTLLAKRWGLPIRLVHVSESISSLDLQLESRLGEMVALEPDLQIDTKHLYSKDPGRAIADTLGPQSLVVLSTDLAGTPSADASTAEVLIAASGAPVLVVGPDAKEVNLEGPVIVALDGSAVAEASLGPAVGLAQSLGRRVWLLRVMKGPAVAEPASNDGHIHSEVGRSLQKLADQHSDDLETRWEVIHSNDPVSAIEAFAERKGCSFLAASFKDRTDPTRHSIHSIAMGLASTAKRPILITRAAPTPAIAPV